MLQIESLEQRQMLSVSMHSAKTKPTIPQISGIYDGTATQLRPGTATEQLTIDISTESTKGVVGGSLTAATITAILVGKVNTKGKVTAKFTSVAFKGKGSIKGAYNSTTHTITGTYKTPGAGHQRATRGTFAVSLST